MLGQQAFVHIVVANSRGAKAFDECGKARVQRFHRMRIVVLIGEVGGMDWVHDRHRRFLAAVRQHTAQRGEIIVEGPEFRLNPRVVLGIEGRIVALALATDGIGVEVLAHLVYTVHILPFGDAFELLGRYVPTSAGESLRDHMLFAQLLRGGRNLARRAFVGDFAAQPVDARYVFIFVKGHDTGTAHHLPCQVALLNGVPRELAIVRGAPIVNLLGEIGRVQLVHQLPIAPAQAGRFFAIHKQRAQFIE